MPDVAKAGSAVEVAVATDWHGALVLPVWETKSWWEQASRNARSIMLVDETINMVHPNVHGYLMWDFAVFVF